MTTQITNLKPEIITEVTISKDLWDPEGITPRVFALDAQTIGISSHPPSQWPEQCLWQGTAEISVEEDVYSILLPAEIVNFYQPKKLDLSVNMAKNRVILVVNLPDRPEIV